MLDRWKKADGWTIHDSVDWRWPNFTPDELADRETGELKFDLDTLDKIQWVRDRLDHPIRINSAFRSAERDRLMGGGGAHPLGKALDVWVPIPYAYELLRLSFEAGFTGIGVNWRGPEQRRFIHLDTVTHELPRPRVWSYQS